MRKECTFKELPERLQEHITAVCDTFEVLKCKRIDDAEFICFVKDGSIIGIFSYRKDCFRDDVSCTWLGNVDIEFLHNALQSTRP